MTWGTHVYGVDGTAVPPSQKERGYVIEDLTPLLASVTISVTVTPLLPQAQRNGMQ
jgi:hypothetical protein